MRFDTRDLAAFQRDFLAAVHTPGKADSAALNIYRDTFFYGLLDNLSETYEITRKAVGDEAFRAFARDYIRAHPLTSGDCNSYGADFSDFLRGHPHLGDRPWLPCLARFEWAVQHAHHAADAPPATFEALLDPQGQVRLHPSVQVLATYYDVKAIYTALRDDGSAPDVWAIECQLLVGRTPQDDVVWLCLARIEVEFIGLIALSGSLASALDDLNPNDTDMTVLQTLLARLVQHGLLINLEESPT